MKQITQLIDMYPFNMAQDIFGSEAKAKELYLPGLIVALTTLDEREQEILRYRYADRLTLEQCGNICGVTRERIRQIQAKALRKLRHPHRANMFRAVPFTEIEKRTIEYQKLHYEHNALIQAFENLAAGQSTSAPAQPIRAIVVAQTPITEIDLSVRAYNCLKRAGKNTLGDIAQMTIEDLLRVRNLGMKSAYEIIHILETYGLSIKPSEGQNERDYIQDAAHSS